MALQPIAQGPWLKGLVASNQPLSQPKGSFPRGSNLVMMERGGLTPCDGSGIINAYDGAVQGNRGSFLSLFLFEPTGVPPYYLAIAKAPDKPLGAPQSVTATDGGAGGSLAPSTIYDYIIVTIDGAGGVSTFSNTASFSQGGSPHKVIVTWNIVPNAYGYIVYRNKSTQLPFYRVLVGAGLPILQPTGGATTASWTDDGSVPDPFSVSIPVLSVGPGRDNQEAAFNLASSAGFFSGFQFQYTGSTDPSYDSLYVVEAVLSPTSILASTPGTPNDGGTGSGGFIVQNSISTIPQDTTQQTVLFRMPYYGNLPISYSDSNIVAYFPPAPNFLGTPPAGSIGGTTFGISNSTPSGGIPGLVCLIPQMKQFTNRVVIALGNGFAPQIYSDSSGSSVNPALSGAITGVSVDSHGTVTVTTSATLTDANIPPGSNVILSGISNALYDGTFVIVSVNTGAGTFTVINTAAIGQSSSSGGSFTLTTSPIVSTFTPAYPVWTASTAYAVGDIIVPATQPTPNIYLTCTQAGTSGSSEPSWDSTIGDQLSDNTVIWTVAALLNSAAPPPPGAAHIEIFAGSLWVLNTSPSNTANGLDGPCALRMSNTNNPNAWNPVNQAFLDKDDGSEGMGLGKFTITALGIPPEGSLIAFKYRVPYQIIGVFGANNFAIQPVSSDMGCLAPRSIQFVPGYGLMRYCHLGIAVFNGFRDEVVSEQIRPYLFPVNDFDAGDITVADANYIPISWGTQTANPPMYCFAMPIGNSGGQLTRIMLYDLVLKAWAAPVDLPFPIGCMAQVQPVTSNPLTIIGGFNDGCLQRWQAGDVNWYTGVGGSQLAVIWSLRTVTVASQNASQRLYARRLMIRGTNTGGAGKITVQPRVSTVVQYTNSTLVPASGDFDVFVDIGLTGLRFDATISGSIHAELDGIDWMVDPRPIGVPVAAV